MLGLRSREFDVFLSFKFLNISLKLMKFSLIIDISNGGPTPACGGGPAVIEVWVVVGMNTVSKTL